MLHYQCTNLSPKNCVLEGNMLTEEVVRAVRYKHLLQLIALLHSPSLHNLRPGPLAYLSFWEPHWYLLLLYPRPRVLVDMPALTIWKAPGPLKVHITRWLAMLVHLVPLTRELLAPSAFFLGNNQLEEPKQRR